MSHLLLFWNNLMKRHIAKILNTDQRCVVVLMQIPGREDHALVTYIDSLPPRYEQTIMSLLESSEGQAEEQFHTILDRRIMPDTGKTVLRSLHEGQMLTPVPISNIAMMPRPNMPFPLVDVLRQMNRDVPNQPNTTQLDEVNKFNQHIINQQADGVEQKTGVATNLLIEAQMLESDARRKREQAYTLNPALRPKPLDIQNGLSEKLDQVIDLTTETDKAATA